MNAGKLDDLKQSDTFEPNWKGIKRFELLWNQGYCPDPIRA